MQILENAPSRRLEAGQQAAVSVLNSYLNQYLARDPRKIAAQEPPSVERLDGMLSNVARLLLPDVGNRSTIAYCQKFSEFLPTKISDKVQNAILKEAQNTDDPDKATRGRRVFFLLNLRTIMTVASQHFSENDRNNEELLHVAMLGVDERISSINDDYAVPGQVSKMTHEIIDSYLTPDEYVLGETDTIRKK